MSEIITLKEFEEIEKLKENTDIKKTLTIISEFWDVHSCVIVKNGIPVGASLSGSPYEAKIKALDCNPIAAVGATIGFSKKIDLQTVKALSRMNFHTIIFTDIDEEGKKYLEKCKSRVINVEFRLDVYKKYLNEAEVQELTPKGFKVATKLKPTQEQVEDMVFAWKVLKNIEKDGILIAKDFKTRAIELGINISAIETAMDNACDGSKEAVLAISKNISDPKLLHPMIQGRITGIIEPKNYEGKDKDVLKTAEKYGITVITVGVE
ncbi:hypothetical protein IJS77_03365 [bacterium]|nr:hypothetical protein [bacterium]